MKALKHSITSFILAVVASMFSQQLGCAGPTRNPEGNISIEKPGSQLPSLDAFGLSGGKIEKYTALAGLPTSPIARTCLIACRYLNVHGHSAVSKYMIIDSCNGKVPMEVLVVGKDIVIDAGTVTRQMLGEHSYSKTGDFVIFPNNNPVSLPGNATKIRVGRETVVLRYSVIYKNGTISMVLSDFLAVIRAHDKQNAGALTVRSWRLTDNLPFSPKEW